MDYKKILKSQKIRFLILDILSFLPDKIMIALQYYVKMGKICNFKNPQTWTEKLQLYKMYYRNPILGKCVDKYEVRSYVKSKGLSDILVHLYGVYNSFSDITFECLPNNFVLKTTDGGGGLNIILVHDKSLMDIKNVSAKFTKWIGNFKKNKIPAGREWAYTGIEQSRIIVEELLINKDNPQAGIEDFKILCFHGEPKYIIVDKDRYVEHKRNIYDINWNRINVTTDHQQFETPYPVPKNIEGMLRVAKILSEDFPFVRVDLYNVEGKIYFGELTFYPWTGYVKFEPESFDRELGHLFDISSFIP
ncbi:MAG: carbonic anhydrase [Mediterranea massiliensis]|nr:carbonic anhydrase [Mediterranea massiliensis]